MAEDVRTPRQARSQARVDRILSAAHRLIARDGIVATSMKRIAAEADVSMASIYQYFPDRGAIVAELCRRALEANGHSMREALTPAPMTLKELLEICVALLRAYHRLLRDEPVLRAAWFDRTDVPMLHGVDEEDSLRNLDLLLDRAMPLVEPDRRPAVRRTIELLFEMSVRGVEIAVRADEPTADLLLAEVEAIIRTGWAARVEGKEAKA